jgi:hypothetical protein
VGRSSTTVHRGLVFWNVLVQISLIWDYVILQNKQNRPAQKIGIYQEAATMCPEESYGNLILSQLNDTNSTSNFSPRPKVTGSCRLEWSFGPRPKLKNQSKTEDDMKFQSDTKSYGQCQFMAKTQLSVHDQGLREVLVHEKALHCFSPRSHATSTDKGSQGLH